MADKPKAYINPGKNSFMTVKVDELKEADQKMMMQKALEMLSKQQAQVSKKDTKDEDDEIPELVNTNFEEVAKGSDDKMNEVE
jgi:hypothetical protein